MIPKSNFTELHWYSFEAHCADIANIAGNNKADVERYHPMKIDEKIGK